MGYTTEFIGAFKLNKPLTIAQARYLEAFCHTRRMKRNEIMTATYPDPIREAAGLPLGAQGRHYVGASGKDCGQSETPDIVEYNNPPDGQPGLWCHWLGTSAGDGIEWDGGEKFYYYVEWLQYIVDHFLKPWGLSLYGEVEWRGEDSDDRGKIIAVDNVISTKTARIIFE